MMILSSHRLSDEEVAEMIEGDRWWQQVGRHLSREEWEEMEIEAMIADLDQGASR